MTDAAAEQFECDACGKSYDWKPGFAGRKVKCACGRIMTAPHAPGLKRDELYDLADDAPPAPSKAGERASTKIATPRIDYQQPSTPGNSLTERYFPDRVRDLYAPLCLIGGGLVVRFGYAAMFASRRAMARSLPMRLADVGLEVCFTTAFMLVGVLIAGKLRSINFGPLPVAIMKLSAVAVAPGAIGILLAPLFIFVPVIGGLGKSIVEFALFFALLGASFDLDQSDTWYCWCIMTLIGISGQLAYLWFWK